MTVELESIDLRPEAAILRLNVYITFTGFVYTFSKLNDGRIPSYEVTQLLTCWPC